MSASRARTGLLALAVVVAAALLAWYQAGRMPGGAPEPSLPPAAAPPGLPAGSPPPTAALPGPLPERPAEGSAPAAEPPRPDRAAKDAGSLADEASRPSFDVVRVEPSGDSVVAGRAAPGATIELLRNGQSFARTVADGSGQFAFVPPPLPPGSSDIEMEATLPDGRRLRSTQSVTASIAERRDQKPLVVVTTPGQPASVLSRPDEPALAAAASPPPPRPGDASPQGAAPGPTAAIAPPAAGGASLPPPRPAAPAPRPEIKIVSVETLGTGRLFVSGQGAPGATVRLYLNDTFVAPATAGADGRLSFSIERGVRPGEYRVRLDDVDGPSGAVRARAEVPFSMPVQIAAAPPPPAPDVALPPPPRRPEAESSAAPGGSASPGARPGPLQNADPPPPASASRPAAPPQPPAAGGTRPAEAPRDGAGASPPARAAGAAPDAGPPVARRPDAEPARGADSSASSLVLGTAPAPARPGASQTVDASPPPAPGAAAQTSPQDAAGTGGASPAARAPIPPPAVSSAPEAAPASSQGVPGRTATSTPERPAPAPVQTSPSQVVVPEVATATVVRGDNLWRISKRTYGEGIRYTVIYGANSPQIRDPDLIYPGQVFVLPNAR